jgi:hypothetical protein
MAIRLLLANGRVPVFRSDGRAVISKPFCVQRKMGELGLDAGFGTLVVKKARVRMQLGNKHWRDRNAAAAMTTISVNND